MKHTLNKLVIWFFISILPLHLFSQDLSIKDTLAKGLARAIIENLKNPAEKLYLQTDKPYYAADDTLWFKAYLLNPTLTISKKSHILYIDIANDSNKVVKHIRVAVQAGLAWGNIVIGHNDFNPGTYTLRAYTNWMRNFGDDHFFYKTFEVIGASDNALLVNARFNSLVVDDKNNLNAALVFSSIDKLPLAAENVRMQVFNNDKKLFQGKYLTGVDGRLNVNFELLPNMSNLTMIAKDEKKSRIAVIPVFLNRAENIDVQFLPEGGTLVSGIPARLGVKAIGEDGKGINVTGVIRDGAKKKVASFSTFHNGMGSFDLLPLSGENYTAKITMPGGTIREFTLPPVKETGTVLQVQNTLKSDSLELTVAASNSIAQKVDNYFLIGKARSIVCYAAIVNFTHGSVVKRSISKSLFPTGITQFTLMTTKYQPLNERQVYIDQNDNLQIKLKTQKPIYGKRDSVALTLEVSDKDGKPVKGNFSLSVTDDTQVKTDTLNNQNILTNLLLTSSLKGYVEEPAYYLSTKNIKTWQALDNLLLTQGWTGYNGDGISDTVAINYHAENEFKVSGQVTNVFNKPVEGANVLLFSKSPSILMDTVTDEAGRFVFNDFPKIDTPIFVIKAVNKNGKSFNVGIKMDELKPPDFVRPVEPTSGPWYVNSDSTILSYSHNKALKSQENFNGSVHMLKEVEINAKKFIRGSQNRYGPADIVLDEKDLEKAGKKTFLQLLEENVKGFHESVKTTFTHDGSPNLMTRGYFIGDKNVFVSIDGIFLNSVFQAFTFDDFKTYLGSHNAEDIRGVEVIDKASPSFVLVEITTRSGDGPLIDNTPGVYLYKPLPLSWPKQFYKPKYIVSNTNNPSPDLRSTIDWEPNITTDTKGEARIWFYTADKASTYTVIVEGIDKNGKPGHKTGWIKVIP